MSGISCDISRALKALGGFEKRVANKLLRGALRKGAKVVQQDAKADAPVGETNELKQSVKVRSGKRKKGQISIEVVADAHPFVEFGTSKMPAEPFLRPAMDANKQDVANQIVNQINDEIGKLNKE